MRDPESEIINLSMDGMIDRCQRQSALKLITYLNNDPQIVISRYNKHLSIYLTSYFVAFLYKGDQKNYILFFNSISKHEEQIIREMLLK